MDRYVFRNPQKPLGVPPPKRITTAAGSRLSTIMESGAAGSNARPANRVANMPFARRFNVGAPPRPDAEKAPPSYTTIHEEGPVEDDNGLLPAWLRTELQRRGGWKRLALIALLIIALAIALGVGLGVGLNKSKSKSISSTAPIASNSTSGSASNSTTGTTPANDPAKFPVGSFSLTTFLFSVATNCTANAATWSCYPYETYSSSPTGSQAILNWVIAASPGNPQQYVISSTDNPFAMVFSNASLTLLDAGLDTERYTFTTPMVKQVWPTSAITPDNNRATCFYNQTFLNGTLYTKMPKTYPAGTSPTNTSSAGGYAPWPAAVQANQYAAGGADVPDCYETQENVVVGSRITQGFPAEPQTSLCSCLYENFLQ